MRLAVVSDVHGNLAALKAVEADLKAVSPDMIVHAGDSAVLGPRPAEVVDRLREIGWTGVVGNTDEMFWNASARSEQERRAPKLKAWLDVLFGDLCPWASERLGNDRIAWLRSQPREWMDDGVRVVHATSTDLWRAPMFDAGDQDLHATYAGNGIELAIYGHIHRPFVRPLRGLTVANSGSVGLPWDGDPRASYLLVEEGQAIVRRVEYDLDRARRDSDDAGFPRAAWLDTVQREGRFSRPA